MADVFIAYARVDSVIAEQLHAALVDTGLNVFRDRNILLGEDWARRIERETLSAKCVLALWTRDSILSGDVEWEAGVGSEKGTLLSVLCDGVTLQADPSAPFRLAYTLSRLKGETVSWNTHATDGLSEVVKAIRKFIESHNGPT